jgi:ubiquinone/menaquinone biosynthesis C-methylase UbiE
VIDLNHLAPSEMARLLGKPEGEPGRAVADMLSPVNAKITEVVYQRLRLKPKERVLEIGFGNGRLLHDLLSCADELSYAGVDIAETMVADANAFNANLVAAGRAAFRLASAEALPFPDRSFDKVFAVNVIYFWREPLRPLGEMRRVLRPGGLSCVASVVQRQVSRRHPLPAPSSASTDEIVKPSLRCIGRLAFVMSRSTRVIKRQSRCPTEPISSGAMRLSLPSRKYPEGRPPIARRRPGRRGYALNGNVPGISYS